MRIPTYFFTIGVLCACWQPTARAEDESPTTQPASPLEAPSAPPHNFMSLNELTAEIGFDAELQHRTVRTDSMGLGQPRFDQKVRAE